MFEICFTGLEDVRNFVRLGQSCQGLGLMLEQVDRTPHALPMLHLLVTSVDLDVSDIAPVLVSYAAGWIVRLSML